MRAWSPSPPSHVYGLKKGLNWLRLLHRELPYREEISKKESFSHLGELWKFHHVTLYKQMDQIYPQELLNELNRKFSIWYLVCIIKYSYNAWSMKGFVVYWLFSFVWKYTPKWMDGLSSKSKQVGLANILIILCQFIVLWHNKYFILSG